LVIGSVAWLEDAPVRLAPWSGAVRRPRLRGRRATADLRGGRSARPPAPLLISK